jgi:poly-D-alanine transfer protein DltD
MPLHGAWYDQLGITYTARSAYYQKLRAIGSRYHAAVVDFADHDADQTFCHDNMGHLAPSGWLYYSQVFDGFFHDELPRQPALAATARAANTAVGTGPPSQPDPDRTLQGRKGKP